MAGREGGGGKSRGRTGGSARGGLELFGHEEARAQVLAAVERGALAPVILVTGPRGIGKEAFGFWLARRLLCEGPGTPPCGSCPSCVKITSLQHPDVHWFFPVPAESTPFGEAEWSRLLEKIRADPLNPAHGRFPQPASFRMHQAATIRRLAATKPFQGGSRVFLLGNYEQNPSDQVHNALLKVLEEPPPRTTFVLTTSRVQGLPPTILSRCQPLRLRPLGRAAMEDFLSAVDRREAWDLSDERKRELAAQAEGRPGRALELHFMEDRSGAEAAELFRAVVEGGAIASYEYALTTGFRGSREEHNRRLDALCALWRDLLRVKASSLEALGRPDLIDLYREAAERLDPTLAAAAALELERGRERIQANVYAPLVFWRIFHALAQALAPARREAGRPSSRS